MSMIQFLFSDGNKISEFKDVLKLSTIEKEGEIPKAILTFPSKMFETIRTSKFCTIKKEAKEFFFGRINRFYLENDEATVELQPIASEAVDKPNTVEVFSNTEEELFEKFSQENPDLFAKVTRKRLDRLGKEKEMPALWPCKNAMEIDKFVDRDSIRIEIDNKDVVTEVNLRVLASWIKIVEGNLDLTTKIANRFPEGKINTMTPELLIDSWPKFGTRLSNYLHSSKTKYAIGHSFLSKAESRRMPDIVVCDDVPKLHFQKTYFDHKLSIFWEFEQFTTEQIESSIKCRDMPYGIRKSLTINLQNVQEYIFDPKEHSFFTSKLGLRILEKIYRSVRDYILLSRRNITVHCIIPDIASIQDLNCGDFIKLKGIAAQIVELRHIFDAFNRKVEIIAKSFSQEVDFNKNLKMPEIARPKRKEFLENDVLYDINVRNNAVEQHTKLLRFINENKLNKMNLKQAINAFLHENQTEINIVTKPLKTQHCEKNIIKIDNIVI